MRIFGVPAIPVEAPASAPPDGASQLPDALPTHAMERHTSSAFYDCGEPDLDPCGGHCSSRTRNVPLVGPDGYSPNQNTSQDADLIRVNSTIVHKLALTAERKATSSSAANQDDMV